MTVTSRFMLFSVGLLMGKAAFGQQYTVTNLTSDGSTITATNADANLTNGWGMARSSSSPWWISSNGQGKATLYDGTGLAKSLVVTVPAIDGTSKGSPTGQIYNGTQDFQVAAGKPAVFLFCTEDGTISGWNGGVSPSAVIMVKNPAAVYKGMTTAYINGAQYLYVANFASGQIEVYDGTFKPVTMQSQAFQLTQPTYDSWGPFEWWNASGGLTPTSSMVPYNVQNIGGTLIIAFAMPDSAKHDSVSGAAMGAVAGFTPAGTMVKRFAHGDYLNTPWGITQAPADFGAYSHSLLVGQFGSGQIVAFNIVTGEVQGVLSNSSNAVLVIDGLWGLGFGNGTAAGPANTLYFSAGPVKETGGLFGSIVPVSTTLTQGNDL